MSGAAADRSKKVANPGKAARPELHVPPREAEQSRPEQPRPAPGRQPPTEDPERLHDYLEEDSTSRWRVAAVLGAVIAAALAIALYFGSGVLEVERAKSGRLEGDLKRTWGQLRMQATLEGDVAFLKQQVIDLQGALGRERLGGDRGSATVPTPSVEMREAAARELRAESVPVPAPQAAQQEMPAPLAASVSPLPIPAPKAAEQPLPPALIATAPAPAPVPDAAPVAPETGSPDNAAASRLVEKAASFIEQGSIASARQLLERAIELGSTGALLSLGETYDPVVLRARDAIATQGDPAYARKLYERALAAGLGKARERLDALKQ